MRELEALPEQKMMTLHCHKGNHTFQIPSRRGRPPLHCADCKAELELARLNNSSSETEEDRAARLAYAREKKREKAQERAQRVSEEEEKDRQRVRAMLPALNLLWNRAWEIANRENTDAAWNKCEQLMVNYVNMRKSLDN